MNMKNLEKQIERLLDTVKRHMEKRGACPHAYDGHITCFKDDCTYCNLVRAYLSIRHPNAPTDSAKTYV